MAKYIKKKDLKRAIEVCTWYHIGKNGELVEGAGVDDEPFYKESDICRIIKDLPTRKINDEANEPYIDIETGILHWQGWKYRRIGDCRDTADTPQTETQTETQNSNLTFEKQTDEEYINNLPWTEKDCPWK